MLIAWPVLATCAVFTVAGVWQLAGPLSPWWLSLVGGIVTLIAAVSARSVYRAEFYGNAQADLAAAVAGVIGLAGTGWLVWTGFAGVVDTWPHLLLIALVATVLWWGLLWNGERIRRKPLDQVAPTPELGDDDIDWQAMLSRVDRGRHEIVEIEEHRAGRVLVCHPRADLDAAPTYDEFRQLAKPFATRAAMEMRRRGRSLPPNAVRTEPGRDDAEYRMAITVRNVFGSAPAYAPDYTPGDVTRALDLGEYEDASRILISLLASNTMIVGATGSGKSVLANNMIGRVTGCGNALVWIGATDKLNPLVWPWLRCYFEGRTERPVLDWVAGPEPMRVLEMLATAYGLCCDRNARLDDESKMRATSDEPALVIFLEETSHAVEAKDKIQTHDGRLCNISQLIKLIVRTGRSANVRLVLMSQSALNSAFGDEAPTIRRQIGNRICLRTNEDHDGYRTLNGLATTVKTNELTDYTLLAQFIPDGHDFARAVPGKAACLDGTQTIGHIAIRNASWRPDIEADADMGPWYPLRWDPTYNTNLARVVERKERQRQLLLAKLDRGEQLSPDEPEPGPELRWRQPGPRTYRPDPLPPQSAPEPPVASTPPPEGNLLDMDAAFDDIARNFTVLPDEPHTSPEPRRSTVLGLPDPKDSALFRTLDDIIARPDPSVPEPQLPDDVARIRAVVASKLSAGARFILTDDLAAAVGAGSSEQMGLTVWRELKIRSRNARADEHPSRRKGSPLRALAEAIQRRRFDM